MNVRRIERFTRQPIPVNVVEGFEPKRSAAPARAGARPGWKPGDGRNAAAKPAQRGFGKPSGAREGGYADRAPSGDRGADSRYADRGPREGFAPRTPSSAPRAGGYTAGAPRAPSGPREGQGQRREGGYKGAHPRSMDGARRSFGE